MKARVLGDGISSRGAKALLQAKGYTLADDAELTIIPPGMPYQEGTVGEIELGMRYVNQPVIGITGTNGKTTLTLLLAHILDGVALGNVGRSFTEYLVDPKDEIICLELSSFQLETMQTRALDCAVITSITPDHLDRHKTFERYKELKWHIADCLAPGGKLFVPFELGSAPKRECTVIDSLESVALRVVSEFGIKRDIALEKIATFKPPAHRLEFVSERFGVAYYNDSKATNVDAVLYALQRMDRPVILLAGGKGKGDSFVKWQKGFEGKVRHVIAFGETRCQMQKELPSVSLADSFEEAFVKAKALAKEGDVVLLSPGCASYDMFTSYEERGEKFKALVGMI